ncbi:fused (3R)-hydroxyacyl-ACP dehydratase subunits HadA/HadB [Nocardia callitridis]|uniref:Dehydratase n=1 Tax=Nocardia callitridis TaxID=648753 RepID=A0ABP9JX71_9NOCA
MTPPDTDISTQAAALTGHRFRVRDHYEVGREKVREFARAVQNHHGAHQHETDADGLGYDALIAPPTFATVIGMAGTATLLDTVLTDYDLSRVLQTDQVFESFRPILAGDRITSEVLIDSIRQFNENEFVVIRFSLTNQRDEVVILGSATIVTRNTANDPAEETATSDASIAAVVDNIMMQGRPADGETTAKRFEEVDALVALGPSELAAPARDREIHPVHTVPTFDELSVGDRLPPNEYRLTRGDLANYAGVSGDANPIHFSEHAAQLAGLPTVVAHGMLTMGLAAGYLTSWLGDPTAISKLAVRFSGFVPVTEDAPAPVSFSGKVKSVDPETRTATILLNGTSEGRKLFGRAVADVRLR